MGGIQRTGQRKNLNMTTLLDSPHVCNGASSVIPLRPTALPVNPDAIPPELKERRRWVDWRFVWKPDSQKWDKPPLQRNGRPAKANDPRTWNSWAAAHFAYLRGGFDGIGYVPTEADGLVFLDLDCVVNSDGTIGTWSPRLRSHFAGNVPEPAELVSRLGTYAELSPSGKGIRIVCKGSHKWPWLSRPVNANS